jgi:hypothetical protein
MYKELIEQRSWAGREQGAQRTISVFKSLKGRVGVRDTRARSAAETC